MLAGDVYAQANEEFQCEHGAVALRRRTMQVAGKPVVHVWRQCTRCGKGLGAVKKHPLSGLREADLEPYDEQLQAAWQERWRARLEQLRRTRDAEESEEWWARYEAYLQTPAWQEKRELVLKRDRYVCQGCGLQRATDVHHLTYEHLGNEFLFELAAICRLCHERLHGRPLGEDAGGG